jgi:hypothetical protein
MTKKTISTMIMTSEGLRPLRGGQILVIDAAL